MVDIPTNEPFVVTAGDTWEWRREDLTDDYPASSWELTYYLVKSGTQIKIIASADGDEFEIEVLAVTTAPYAAGTYHWHAYVDDGTKRKKVDQGVLEIKPDFETQTSGYDDRTHVKKVLDAIEAVIEGRASQDQMSYAIAGRSLSRTPIPDLLVLRDQYKGEYDAEQTAERIANGLGTKNKIKLRFI